MKKEEEDSGGGDKKEDCEWGRRSEGINRDKGHC